MAADDVIVFKETQIPRACDKCGRVVMHSWLDGTPQPHYEPRAGQKRCVPRSAPRSE